MNIAMNIRIPAELKNIAAKKAKAEGISMNTLVVQFLESYVADEYELKIVPKKPSFPEGIIQI